MVLATDTNQNMYQFVSEDAEILSLEKAAKRPLDVKDISKALDEYKRLYKAGIHSPAELMTLVRAFPENKLYTGAAQKMGLFDDDFEPMVVGGPASVELVDREGHLITNNALSKAFEAYMENFRTRNAMVLHSDVQVGWALPAYISKAGNIYKSGVDPKGLFFITELRDDTRIAKRVMEQIKEGKLKSYSIAGSATKTQNIQKGMESYMQVDDIIKSDHAHDVEYQTTLLIKEDGNVDFLASFLNLMKDQDPFTNTSGTKDTNVLGQKAYEAREQLHHRLLDEQGFPAELEPEWNRYIPVSETEVDEEGKVIHQKPPWVVNEAGDDLGTRWTNEALSPPKGKPHAKPYNLQKFFGFTGQRKKGLIIEGHDSAFLTKDIDQTETSVPAINQFIDEVRTNKVGDQPYAEAPPKLLSILVNVVGKHKGEKPVKKFLPKLIMDILLSNRNKKTLKKGVLGEAGKIVAAEVGKKVGESVTDKLKKSGD